MIKVPQFKLYGKDDPEIQETIQPQLSLRPWDDLTIDEKEIMLQELTRRGWHSYSEEALQSVMYLNRFYLRLLPGKRLHAVIPNPYSHDPSQERHKRLKAGHEDFEDIFVNGKPGEMVLTMLSVFINAYINRAYLNQAKQRKDDEARGEAVESTFEKFDRLAYLLNRIFEQFSINILVTRNGFIPRQDDKIDKEIYQPTLKVLSDPGWKSVNAHLVDMFNDYHAQNYPEVITKAHSVLQRFLQILVGEEGKSAKGEVGKLLRCAKRAGVVSNNSFVEPVVNAIQSFIVKERATNSTAKPALQQATASDALLVMNVTMVFLQHCLQNTERAGKQ